MAPRELGALEPPPTALSTRALPILHRREPLTRVHRLDREPKFFGKTGNNRFDAPGGEFGVLYAAADHYGAFIETFGDPAHGIVTASSLQIRGFATIELGRELAFVDLTGEGLAQIGADARLFAGEHGPAQQWSFALWKHPAAVDGLCYRARHDPFRLAFAIYERAADFVRAIRRGALIDVSHRALLADILEHYRFAFIDK